MSVWTGCCTFEMHRGAKLACVPNMGYDVTRPDSINCNLMLCSLCQVSAITEVEQWCSNVVTDSCKCWLLGIRWSINICHLCCFLHFWHAPCEFASCLWNVKEAKTQTYWNISIILYFCIMFFGSIQTYFLILKRFIVVDHV